MFQKLSDILSNTVLPSNTGSAVPVEPVVECEPIFEKCPDHGGPAHSEKFIKASYWRVRCWGEWEEIFWFRVEIPFEMMVWGEINAMGFWDFQVRINSCRFSQWGFKWWNWIRNIFMWRVLIGNWIEGYVLYLSFLILSIIW